MAYIAHMKGILGKSARVDYTPNSATGDEMRLAEMTPAQARHRPLRPSPQKAPEGQPMFPFVRRRMYTSALPLIIVLLGVFLLARLTGDPTNLYLPESATPEQRDAFARAERVRPAGVDSAGRLLQGRHPPRLRHLAAHRSSRRPRWRCGPSPPPSNSPSPQCFWRSSWPSSSAAGRPTGPTRWPTGSPACCP